jgi:uncharacterized protein (DUF433 family)
MCEPNRTWNVRTTSRRDCAGFFCGDDSGQMNVRTTSRRDCGAWIFRGTRVPVRALFENLADGATMDDFLQWFPGVQRSQAQRRIGIVVLMATSWNRERSCTFRRSLRLSAACRVVVMKKSRCEVPRKAHPTLAPTQRAYSAATCSGRRATISGTA